MICKLELLPSALGLTHLSVLLCTDPSTQPHIQEQDVTNDVWAKLFVLLFPFV